MARKKTEVKEVISEARFTKEQIITSKKYANKKDICKTVIPEKFEGTLKEADELIEKFMKGKVK